jgi:5'-nucleotidase
MCAVRTLDWSAIDTVLLDMDGTLLDLRFDNWFWLSLVPHQYALAHGISEADAQLRLKPLFDGVHGTLKWYCVEHWSRELGLDIVALKRAAGERIEFLPGAEAFLAALRTRRKRVVLVTNAHPHALAIKDERLGLLRHFDASYSTHRFDAPKERAEFWPRLQAQEDFQPARTLFVDDSRAVLATAREYGIAHLRMVAKPDSGRPPQATAGFTPIEAVAELLLD